MIQIFLLYFLLYIAIGYIQNNQVNNPDAFIFAKQLSQLINSESFDSIGIYNTHINYISKDISGEILKNNRPGTSVMIDYFLRTPFEPKLDIIVYFVLDLNLVSFN